MLAVGNAGFATKQQCSTDLNIILPVKVMLMFHFSPRCFVCIDKCMYSACAEGIVWEV